MLDRHSATARLAAQMSATEDAVSAALIEALSLMNTAALAQRDVAADPVQTQTALLRMNKLVESLIAAQSEAMRTHGQLSDVSKIVNGAEEPYCPPASASAPATSSLQIAQVA